MKKVLEKRKDIAFYLLLYPLPIHPDSARISKSIQCEKSLALLDDAFEKKSIPDPTCITSGAVIDENVKIGQKLGINGTPALVLPNGLLVSGYRDADALIKLVDSNPAGKK
jgi:thiol:disulfide interchange protein DsbC